MQINSDILSFVNMILQFYEFSSEFFYVFMTFLLSEVNDIIS